MMETLENHVSYLSKYAMSMFQESEDIREVGSNHSPKKLSTNDV